MEKNTPAKRNPLFSGGQPLEFDNVSSQELSKLTEAQKADKFLSRWMELMDPFVAYRRYFEESAKEDNRILKEVKNYYTKYVVRGSWTEKKYAMIVDSILMNRVDLTPKSFERAEELYNEERLPVQLEARRKRRRRL